MSQTISVISNKQKRCGLFLTRIKLVARVLAWGCDRTHQMDKTAVSQDLLIILCLWHFYQVTADNQSAVFVKRQNINMKKLTTTFNCLSCPTLREKCPNTELFLVRIFTQCNIQDWSFSADLWWRNVTWLSSFIEVTLLQERY